MKKYCFEVTKEVKVVTKVIVNAESLEEAEKIIDKACENEQIDFEDSIDEEESVYYEIDGDSCLDDDSFNEEEFSDEGLQIINDVINVNNFIAEEYAKENDNEYGNCGTCKHYGKGNVCSYCIEGSEYEFDAVHYIENFKEAIVKWIGRC